MTNRGSVHDDLGGAPSGAALVMGARRPGELHDVIRLGDEAAVLAAKASSAGIELDLAATLLVELQLLRADLAAIDRPMPDLPAPQVARRLSAADAGYLRLLTFRRPRPVKPAAIAALPVRIISRVNPAVIRAATAGTLEDAIQWETASLLDGRTIGELGALLATAATARF